MPLKPCKVIPDTAYQADPGAHGPVDFPLLAEGDSWFSANGQPGDNLLQALSASGSSFIVSFANPGDPIRRMAKMGKQSYLRTLLRDPNPYWRAWLLSGGGNDLIDDADNIIGGRAAGASAVDPASWVDDQALRALIESVQQAYRDLAALRAGGANPRLPILAHTYDYAMPRPAPTKFLGFELGPWLKPALTNAQVPDGMQSIVADYLFNRLAEGLLALDATRGAAPIPGMHVCDTRGVLLPANPTSKRRSNDWLNEIHPVEAGYLKIAQQRLNAALARILAG